MKRFRNVLTLAVAIVGASLMSVSAQNGRDRYDRPITSMEQQIFKKLNGLPHYGVFDHITFEVNGGTVVLEGKVHSLGTRSSAAKAVKKVPGVTNVINNIDQLPPSSNDNRIRRRALQTFANAGLYRYFWETDPQVRIIVEGSRITLEGYVANRGDYNRLNIYANGLSGVFSVTNNLIIDNGRDG